MHSPHLVPFQGSPTPPPLRHSQRTPHRTTISIKSRRQRAIPEIKIQLDEVLTEAYSELVSQPRKNARLGEPDLYVLNNDLLKEYVQSVYEEYHIDDPLAGRSLVSGSQQVSRRSNSNLGFGIFQTPSKSATLNKELETEARIEKRQTRTSEKLNRLKQNFQTELNSSGAVILSQNKQSRQRQASQTQKKTQLKIIRRPSNNPEQPLPITHAPSHILTKTKHKYCLVCEAPLQAEAIKTHEQHCQPLKQLLSTVNLKITVILQILDQKIAKLEAQIAELSYTQNQDSLWMGQIIESVLCSQEVHLDESQASREEDTLLRKFSALNSVRCMESISKLQWFRRMRAKAQLKQLEERVE